MKYFNYQYSTSVLGTQERGKKRFLHMFSVWPQVSYIVRKQVMVDKKPKKILPFFSLDKSLIITPKSIRASPP